jgi:hypothetical protein
MALAPLALSLVGTGMQMNAQRQAGQANQRANNFNAAVSEQEARDALARGEETAANYGTQIKGLIGKQKASYAAQGIEVNSGSAADVQESAQVIGDRDLRTIRLNAMRESWGYKMQAKNYKIAGKNAATAGNFNAAGTALQGAGDAYGKYTDYKTRTAGA